MPRPSAKHLARCNEAMTALPMAKEVALELVAQDEGIAVTEATVTEAASGGSGQLHGTHMYALMDYTAFLAVVTALGDEQSAATHDANFTLMDAVPRGATVRYTGRLDRIGRHIAFLSVDAHWVVGDAQKLVARARITKTVMSVKQRYRKRKEPSS